LPRKLHVRAQRFDEPRADAGHAVKTGETAKRAVLVSPRDDPLRQRGADAGQSRDLRHVGAIEVDALAREQRAGEARGRAGGFPQPAGWRRVDRGELHVARRCGGRGSERIADPGAGQREAGEEQCGVTVVHAAR